MRTLTYTKDDFVKALMDSCTMTELASKVGVHRVTLYAKLKSAQIVPNVQNILAKNREMFLSFSYETANEDIIRITDAIWTT